MNTDEMLNLLNHLNNIAETNPEYGLKLLDMEPKNKKEALSIIERIDQINEELPKEKNRTEKGKLTFEKGRLLENLASRVLNEKNLFSVKQNLKCDSNEIDLLLQPASNNMIYNMFLPNFMKDDIIIECKNYNKGIDVTWTGKVYSLLNYKKVKAGIIFSYYGLKGKTHWDSAKGLVKKFYLKDDILIINITIDDIKKLLESNDDNIIKLIQRKVNEIKYHTDFEEHISQHPSEVANN